MTAVFRLVHTCIVFVLFLSILPVAVQAASLPVSGKAEVMTTGNSYLDFTGYTSNVTIDTMSGDFSGYAFLEDVGWVAFGVTDNPGGPVTVNITTGEVTGQAKVLATDALIDFTNYNSNVVIALPQGVFSGYAFSEDVGWINFSDTGVSTTTSFPASTTGFQANNGSSGTQSTAPPSCTAQTPSSAPKLYAAIPENGNAIRLYFTDAGGPIDHYALSYGLAPGQQLWGQVQIGGNGTRTYLVEDLIPNTTYYFTIRGGNGCASGAWSNEISTKTLSWIARNKLVLTRPKVTSISTTKNKQNACTTYTVRPGDTLWNIATSQTGSGTNYPSIISENKSTHPSLITSNALKVNWKLSVGCTKGNKAGGSENSVKTVNGVSVTILDKENKPVPNAKVTLHSKVQHGITDENGKAQFANVEPGNHRVIISYDGFTGEQALDVTDISQTLDVEITTQPKNVLFSPFSLLLLIGLGSSITLFFFLLSRFYRQKKALAMRHTLVT